MEYHFNKITGEKFQRKGLAKPCKMDVYCYSGEEREWDELGGGLLKDLIIGLLKYWRIYLVVSLLDCLIVENVYSKQRNNRNFYFSFCLRIKILKK